MAGHALERLLPQLESDDAFVRLEAEQRLRGLLLQDFGFRWDAPDDDREAALERIKAWIAAREAAAAERKEAEQAPSLDLEKLQSLSPTEVEAHLQKLIEKAPFLQGLALRRSPCTDCRRQPATVEVVVLEAGVAAPSRQLCDECAVIRGEIRA